MIYESVLDMIGNTPIVSLRQPNCGEYSLFAKLEGYNPFGSAKDRPSYLAIANALQKGVISEGGAVVESSSGNMAVALALICRALRLRFIAVVDLHIQASNLTLLRAAGARIELVKTQDANGNSLEARIARAQQIALEEGAFWLNQYENADCPRAHHQGTGAEILEDFGLTGLDYVFIPVSTGGLVAGVSGRLREAGSSAKVIAVDVQGSAVFGGMLCKRVLSGIGASRRGRLFNGAEIDDVCIVHERECVAGCRELLLDHGLCCGASSGGTFMAAQHYLDRLGTTQSPPRALLIFPDRGDRYAATVFDNKWVTAHQLWRGLTSPANVELLGRSG